MRALLDTSAFIAAESRHVRTQLPEIDQTEVSVITLAELTIGVLTATEAQRPQRLATLSLLETTWRPMPIDADVARVFARVVADLRRRRRRVPVLDALVAATAMSADIPVVTQDRDFSAIDGLVVVPV